DFETKMNTTPISLLARLRHAAPPADWNRFVILYTPLLCHWARRLGASGADVDDLVQEVLTIFIQQLPEFRYDPQRRFRGWLWTILANKVRAARRRAAVLHLDKSMAADIVDEPQGDDMEEAEYRDYLVQRVLPLIKPEFQP